MPKRKRTLTLRESVEKTLETNLRWHPRADLEEGVRKLFGRIPNAAALERTIEASIADDTVTCVDNHYLFARYRDPHWLASKEAKEEDKERQPDSWVLKSFPSSSGSRAAAAASSSSASSASEAKSFLVAEQVEAAQDAELAHVPWFVGTQTSRKLEPFAKGASPAASRDIASGLYHVRIEAPHDHHHQPKFAMKIETQGREPLDVLLAARCMLKGKNGARAPQLRGIVYLPELERFGLLMTLLEGYTVPELGTALYFELGDDNSHNRLLMEDEEALARQHQATDEHIRQSGELNMLEHSFRMHQLEQLAAEAAMKERNQARRAFCGHAPMTPVERWQVALDWLESMDVFQRNGAHCWDLMPSNFFVSHKRGFVIDTDAFNNKTPLSVSRILCVMLAFLIKDDYLWGSVLWGSTLSRGRINNALALLPELGCSASLRSTLEKLTHSCCVDSSDAEMQHYPANLAVLRQQLQAHPYLSAASE
jgi:hypothetical protein